MNLRSTCSLAAMIGLAVAVAPPASAAMIVDPFLDGPFDAADPFGTFIPLTLVTTNTYDFTFTIAGTGGPVLTEVQASIFGVTGKGLSAPIDYSLYSGSPGSGALIGTSSMMTGPSLAANLGAGSYYLQIDHITYDGELLSGGLEATAAPEPAAWGMMLLGLAGLGVTMRSIRPKRAIATA